MVGVDMGFQTITQLEAKLLKEIVLTLHLFQNRIDQNSLLCFGVSNQIGIRFGFKIEQLPKTYLALLERLML